ncbi:hypothetical protein AVEN_69735-1 [Araneus ventricosus]|uniref:Mos1 transposase HTH domain-containing protein n=1 Tax=Araneus ventricosus TaxID=182803 RepID=A0A4Y2CXQ9_ARAVE|nr:hypothetical protein AVEN_69735-1 [Araneus ventricosus]
MHNTVVRDCGDAALPYCAVVRWLKMFRDGRNVTQDQQHSGQHQVDNQAIQLVAGLMEVDQQWTSRELSAEITNASKLCSIFCSTSLDTARLQRDGSPICCPRCNFGTVKHLNRNFEPKRKGS